MRRERTASRRQFMTTTASAVAAATILPRHVLGGPGFVAPSDKVNVAIIGVGGQGRSNLRSLLHEDACQVIAIADPCEEWDLQPVLLRRKGRAGPDPRRDRGALPREDPQLQVRRARGLPGDAGEGEGDRRRPDRHPGPPPRLRLDPRHEGRQARLLREAADPRHRGGPHRGPGRQGDGRRHADGQPGALDRGASPDRRVDLGRRHRPRPRGALLGRRRGLRQGTRAPGGHSGGAAGPQLGPVAGAPRVPPVPPGLRAVRLARVLGLRGRGAAGSRDPPPRPGVQRARARHPADRGGHGLRRRGRGGLLGAECW